MSEQLARTYNILSVDDNQNNLFTLSVLLGTQKNIKSIEVLTAKEALNVLLTEKIDLILLDVQMPEINGFELAKMIKSNKKTKDIPIIFVTAVFKSEEFIKEGFEIGAVDYITKPIDDNQLINKIILYLKVFDEKNRLVQSEKRFYDIAQSIGDGIYTLDTENKTTFINNEALKILGFEHEELIGKNIHDYIHYKDIRNKPIASKHCPVHNTILHGDKYISENEYLVKKDGTFVQVSLVATPLFIDYKTVGTVVIFRDKMHQQRILSLEEEKSKNQEQIIHSMINMIESRDSYTAGHTKRVAEYCVLIAKEMGYSDAEIEILKNAAWLHDIGKISTPDSILLKPNRLNETEYELIQEHLRAGYEMLSEIDQYKVMADVMREHHEKYNGSGYPRGLKANEIQPLSRIMMVADAFDAMTTNRVYKPRKSISAALRELKELSAVHFHPEVVDAAVAALKKVEIDTEISQLPRTIIEEQRFSYFYRDRLTNLFVLEYLSLILRYHIASKSVYMYKIQLHNFSDFNKKFSWAKGDAFLVEFSKFIDSLYSNTITFRVEGDDFMILSENALDNINEDIQKSELLKNSIIVCSVETEYIDDINNKFEYILRSLQG
ncbi:MAG: HD domain-containing phosphohydrolase [Sulfurimonas sp.]|jgi:PAS domain S-box-containing protein/putative nucleotidyltransferase with HDIG domain